MMFLHPLDKTLTERDFGGKAAGLSRISMSGMSVPPGWALHKAALKDYQESGSFPENLHEEIKGIIDEISSAKVIVRSSGIGEDSDDYSFAGQFDSFVVEKSTENIVDAIKRCWMGLSNDRVKAYQEISGLKLSEMGVVIQNFVDAEYSGVLFTQSPYDAEEIYGEYLSGGAEPLVSGRVTPESFSVTKNLKCICHGELPFNYKDLINSALKLKADFGKELDIEWLYADKCFHFVQARPIKITEKERVAWTSTNLNENYPHDISPLLASVARDSYYFYFKNLSKLLNLDKHAIEELEADYSSSVGFFGNRIYYNMTSIHNIIAASPYSRYFKAAFNNFVGYSDQDASTKKFSRKSSLLSLILKLAWLNFRLPHHVKKIDSKVAAFAKGDNDQNSFRALSDRFHGFLNLRFYQWYHASLADLFSMIHYKLLGTLTKRLFGSDDTGIHNTLIQAIPGLYSRRPLNDSWRIIELISEHKERKEFFLKSSPKDILTVLKTGEEWKDINSRIENYLLNWGFRCSEELLLNSDNYIDSPEKYIELLQTYIRAEQVNPAETVGKKNRDRRKVLRKAITKTFVKRHILFPLAIVESLFLLLIVRLCRGAIYSREQVRYRQAQMYYSFRKTVSSAGKRFTAEGFIENKEDILFLSYKEISGLLSQSDIYSKSWSGIVNERKEIYKAESEKKFPESFETINGNPVGLDIDNHDQEFTGELSGLAASGGRVKARAKVLSSVMEIEKLRKGDILVTGQTDPGWAMAFPIIGGLIVERGGALSHGAIVAREFGIPAVLGVDNATELIKDNDEIILDGNTGKIIILS